MGEHLVDIDRPISIKVNVRSSAGVSQFHGAMSKVVKLVKDKMIAHLEEKLIQIAEEKKKIMISLLREL